jgi:hypothetical protein
LGLLLEEGADFLLFYYDLHMMVAINQRRPTLAHTILKRQANRARYGVSAAAAAIIVVVIMLLAFGIYLYAVPPKQQITPGGVTTTSTLPFGAYSLNAATTGYDHFNPGTTYVAGTNFNTLWDALVAGAYQQIGSNTQTIAIQPSYGGTVYAVVTVPSGQNYYVDPYTTQQRNSPLVSGWQYTSVANNGINNFVFKLSNIPGATNPISPLDFYPYFIASATQTLNSPSAITSVGSSPVTEFIQWQTTVPSGTPNVGSMIKEIQITVNSTSAAVFQLNSVNDPATFSSSGPMQAGLVQGSQFTPQQGSTNYIYTYPIGSSVTDLSSGQWILYGTNSLDQFPYTLSGTFDFGAATGVNCLNVAITIYVLSPSGAISTLSNSVNVAQGSVC